MDNFGIISSIDSLPIREGPPVKDFDAAQRAAKKADRAAKKAATEALVAAATLSEGLPDGSDAAAGGVASSFRPEGDPGSVPAAEVLPSEIDTVTQPNAAILTPEQANKLFPTENYDAYTGEQLHNTNIKNLEEGERLHGKFTAHLYDQVLPALNETIKRLKGGEEINGYSGERQVGAYLESIGYSAKLVRQWNKRYRDRMADLKKALGLTDGSGDSKLTPDQRELRDMLKQQGYKNPEATRLTMSSILSRVEEPELTS